MDYTVRWWQGGKNLVESMHFFNGPHGNALRELCLNRTRALVDGWYRRRNYADDAFQLGWIQLMEKVLRLEFAALTDPMLECESFPEPVFFAKHYAVTSFHALGAKLRRERRSEEIAREIAEASLTTEVAPPHDNNHSEELSQKITGFGERNHEPKTRYDKLREGEDSRYMLQFREILSRFAQEAKANYCAELIRRADERGTLAFLPEDLRLKAMEAAAPGRKPNNSLYSRDIRQRLYRILELLLHQDASRAVTGDESHRIDVISKEIKIHHEIFELAFAGKTSKKDQKYV